MTHAHQVCELRPVDEDGRAQVRISDEPDAIRTLTALLDQRGIPDTYVRDGELIVVEAVSGTAPAAGDDDAPLPLSAGRVTSARLAALLAEHLNIVEYRAAG